MLREATLPLLPLTSEESAFSLAQPLCAHRCETETKMQQLNRNARRLSTGGSLPLVLLTQFRLFPAVLEVTSQRRPSSKFLSIWTRV